MNGSLRHVALCVAVFTLAAGCECSTAPTTKVAITINIDPPSVSLTPGSTQRFTASVVNGANEVRWSVEEANGGKISQSGEYTAPLTLGAYHVRVESAEDRTAFARATITVLPEGVAIGITPSEVTVKAGATQQFAAAVTGTIDVGINWSVLEADGGTVTSNGLYTAPSVPGKYTVVATAAAEAGIRATATVTVTEAVVPTITINPSVTTVGVGQPQQYTAVVTGIASQDVLWSVGANGGTITAGGLYTAPLAPGVYNITATSQVVPEAVATATVTVVPISVNVSPATALVEVGSTQQFTAAVSGLTNMQVTWSVQEGISCGVINSSGVYSPPSTLGTCTVVATAANGQTGTATVTVINPITLQVVPSAVNLRMNQKQQFTAVVTGTTNQAVTWTVREGAVGGTVDAQGLYTAPTVVANSTFHVVATAQANPARTAEATISVQPGIGVQVTPQTVTLTPGAQQNFTATVTGTSNTAVTWAVLEGAGGGTVDATGHYTAPAGGGTFHVVASSVADPDQKGLATVVVLGAPVDISGTVTYTGSKTGIVHVILASSDTAAGVVGTATLLTAGKANFTLRGVRQRGDMRIRAFVDTAGTGMYHVAADPFGSMGVTVGDSGLSGLTVALEDANWNRWLSLATPSIDRVIGSDESALIAWKPALDFSGREECKTYRVFWSDSTGVSSSNNIGSLEVKADAPRLAIVRGLLNGQKLYFTMTCPDAFLGGRAPEVGPITIGTPTGGFQLSGVVNSPAITNPVVAPLYVVAFDRAASKGFMTRIASPAASQAWVMQGLTASTYDVFAFRDVAGDGKLTPTDVGTFYSPTRVKVDASTGVAPLTISSANGLARVLTGHLDDSGTHSYSIFVRVLPNMKRPAKVTVTSGAKIAVPYDVPLNETGGSRHEVWINLTNTAPEVGDAYNFDVTYSDGTTETLTAKVTALLPTPAILSPTPSSSATPSFQWLPLSPTPALSYTLSLRVYDWTYVGLGTLATLKGSRDDIASSTTLLLYNDINPTSAQLNSNLLSYWWHLRAEDSDGNWSQTITSFGVK